jgi:hypothetical protein
VSVPRHVLAKLNDSLKPCAEHGFGLCYVNRNGNHVAPSLCTCERDGRMCPVDEHRIGAAVADAWRPFVTIAQVAEQSGRLREAEQSHLFGFEAYDGGAR